jgi:PBSX family phage portal protein
MSERVDVVVEKPLGANAYLYKFEGGVVSSSFQPVEDPFSKLYRKRARPGIVSILPPPYNPYTLEALANQNNALRPCIEAMVTNIETTGYTIEPKNSAYSDTYKDDIERLTQFFDEPWPGESFISLRKKIRRDIETLGNAYIEVIRNLAGQIVFLRHLDGKMIRLVRLDEARLAEVRVRRNGTTMKMKMMMQYRRFVQMSSPNTGNSEVYYFKEFGCPWNLNKLTGEWSDAAPPINEVATEILHIIAIPDVDTPYGVPRWINELPSVLGSRKAEEHNLTFFDSGGIPPVLIIVQGGVLSTQTREALESKFLATNSGVRAAIVEAFSTAGSLDSTGNVKVQVERFGAERQMDAMFEKYDTKCEARVRRAFRLPPLFVGDAADYAFATAYASYTVAEAQVFKPERDEFDTMLTLKLLPELTSAEVGFHSNPLSVKDPMSIIKAATVVSKYGSITHGELVRILNDAVAGDMKVMDELKDDRVEDLQQAQMMDLGGEEQATPVEPPRAKPRE